MNFRATPYLCFELCGEIILNEESSKNHWCAEIYSEFDYFNGVNLKPPDSEPDYKEPLVIQKNKYYPE